jgi:hypothetical protein
LGRALMDTAFGAVIERRFSGEGKLATRWKDSVSRGIAALERTDGGARHRLHGTHQGRNVGR